MTREEAYSEYRAALGSHRIRQRDIDPARLAAHIPLLERLDAVDSSSVVVYDLFQQRYVFLTSSFRFLLGYSREDALAEGPEYFYRRMQPDDLLVVLDSVTQTFRFLERQPPESRSGYKLSFDFRIRAADERMIRLVQQVVVLELDARGNPWLVLAVNDLAPEAALDAPAGRRLVSLKDGSTVLFSADAADAAESPAPFVPRLSKREIEILGLVGAGMASREIADRLFISVATVNNHRQNILSKMHAKNSADAVRYAAKAGLL